MINKLGDPILPELKKALDIYWLRQQVISQNIANADTPNYKRIDVDFERVLAGKMAKRLAMNRTHGAHLSGGSNRTDDVPLVAAEGTRSRNDNNNVDLEQEMALQAETVLLYNLLTRLTTEHLGMLRLAITEGRR
ncbi:MAG TPA: flagellar basal body rod protein FlgB [Syntrophaceticus sp.]|nr:flagellar basal body rod protein FlgB [Syntrophaceticus sp.]